MIRTRTSFALVAASALLLLTGCSGGGDSTASEADTNDTAGTSETTPSAQPSDAPAADQSKADACQIVQEQFQAVSQAGSSIDTSDPQGTLTKFRELANQVGTEIGGVTNEEVAPVAQKASGALDEYATFLEALIADPSKASGLGDQVTALQQSFSEAAAVCAS